MVAWILRTALLAQLLIVAVLGHYLASHYVRQLSIPGAYALALFLVLILRPLLLSFNFMLSRLFCSPTPDEFRLTPLRWLRMLDAEIDASLKGFGYAHPFQSRRKAPAPTGPVRPVPILFIHGYFCNRAIWHPFMREAARRGYQCEAVTLEPVFGSIDDYAEVIETQANELMQRAQCTQLFIIGHSMGGLAARAWLSRYDRGQAKHLITLGTPHSGSIFAHFANGINARQMTPESPWLTLLGARESANQRSRITSIFSFQDELVAPQLSASLDGAHNIPMAGIGHVRLVYDPKVWDRALSELNRYEPEATRHGETDLPKDSNAVLT